RPGAPSRSTQCPGRGAGGRARSSARAPAELERDLVERCTGKPHEITVAIAVRAEPRKFDLYPGEIFVGTSQQGLEDFPALVLEGWGHLGRSDRERGEFARQLTIDDNPASTARKDGSDLSVDDADAD